MAIDLNGSTGISLDDNEKINIGNDSDLQIYHDGSNSYIDDAGTGNLYLRASNAIIIVNNITIISFFKIFANKNYKFSNFIPVLGQVPLFL